MMSMGLLPMSMRWVWAASLCGAAALARTKRGASNDTQPAPRRLLYPIMVRGGPNNQYQQYFESLLLAKTLKRGIVLAPFLSWTHDREHRAHAFASTFDVDALARFIPVASVDALGSYALGSALATCGHVPSFGNLRTVCAMAHLRCADEGRAIHSNLKLDGLAAKKRCEKSGTRATCRAAPLVNRPVMEASLWNSIPAGLFDRGATTSATTMAALRALRRAPTVRKLAAAARRAIFGPGRPRYVCAHVRRVEDDQRCKDGGSRGAPKVSCGPKAKGYAAPADLAGVIARVAKAAKLTKVYVARASAKTLAALFGSQEGDVLLRLLRETLDAHSLSEDGALARLLNASSLTNYDVSLVEQELCATASVFVATEDSTWSSLVAHQRAATMGRGGCSTSFERWLATSSGKTQSAPSSRRTMASLVADAFYAAPKPHIDAACVPQTYIS